ncbi:MAG: isoprenyl transferase [Candidatus Sumerlaeaceae bacterium]|nr:isoprenyl transferase [Candidatus Sumerlaeaceae bacterium]
MTQSNNQIAPGRCFLEKVRDRLTDEERQLLLVIDPAKLPQHVAIIMDGNGRWAKQRGYLDRIRGHEAGIDSVRTVVRACGELGLRALTLYAFSVENWKRPQREIDALMNLLKRFLREEINELNENNVRLVASGRLHDLGEDVLAELHQTMQATASNSGLVLNLALSYGGRAEIVDAVRKLVADVLESKIRLDDISEHLLSRYLYHPELGDPDLLIRTSGEMRVSNFLLWQIAYTEFYVTSVLWPDFRRADLYRAILDYQRRERRFGGVTEA